MAVEIRITRELSDYSPKFVGPLTARQTLCVVPAGAVIYLMYSQLRPYLPVDVIGFMCLVPAAIAWAFGWARPYGMRTEVFLRSIFITMFLAPATRKYKMTNRYSKLFKTIEEAELKALESESSSGKRKKQKIKKQKYKRSSLAYK